METRLQLVPDRHDDTDELAATAGPTDTVGLDDGDGAPIPFVVPTERRRGGRWAKLVHDERGAVTAEYAIVIMAAVAFAGLLVAILRSSEIRAMLVQLVEDALGAAG